MDRILDVNLCSAFRLSRHVLAHLANAGGFIVNISSTFRVFGGPAASKAGPALSSFPHQMGG
ncbi:hypothetical protein [Cupriavidus pauculus]|uniref:hypothetical protein n=1 Tax=Cupriavidus pauculus TaxID=82633 RepID=UPI0012FD251B